jgi:protein MpaA
MDDESTGEALLAAVESLGLPVIGQSHAGRFIYGGPAPETHSSLLKRPLLLMAGIHGDEPASVAAVLELWARWSSLPPPPCPVWIVPALNPDGLAAGTKNSSRDVDLNRNFPAKNFTVAHRSGYDPGPGPLSEPETAAFAALVRKIDPVGVVAVHAPFACINYDGPAADWAKSVALACGWPAQADLGYPTPGSLGSWLGVDCGLPILTIELPKGPLAGFREAGFRSLAAAIGFPPGRPVKG